MKFIHLCRRCWEQDYTVDKGTKFPNIIISPKKKTNQRNKKPQFTQTLNFKNTIAQRSGKV